LLTLYYLSNIINSQRDFELKQQERREYGDSWTNQYRIGQTKKKLAKLNKEHPSHQSQMKKLEMALKKLRWLQSEAEKKSGEKAEPGRENRISTEMMGVGRDQRRRALCRFEG
jgi:hypothetical protein